MSPLLSAISRNTSVRVDLRSASASFRLLPDTANAPGFTPSIQTEPSSSKYAVARPQSSIRASDPWTSTGTRYEKRSGHSLPAGRHESLLCSFMLTLRSRHLLKIGLPKLTPSYTQAYRLPKEAAERTWTLWWCQPTSVDRHLSTSHRSLIPFYTKYLIVLFEFRADIAGASYPAALRHGPRRGHVLAGSGEHGVEVSHVPRAGGRQRGSATAAPACLGRGLLGQDGRRDAGLRRGQIVAHRTGDRQPAAKRRHQECHRAGRPGAQPCGEGLESGRLLVVEGTQDQPHATEFLASAASRAACPIWPLRRTWQPMSESCSCAVGRIGTTKCVDIDRARRFAHRAT